MELLPAIDLRGGTAVRLTQGDFDREQRYGDPAELARRGTSTAALAGSTSSTSTRRVPACRTSAWRWARSCTWPARSAVRVQAGGGIRSDDAAEELLESGVARVVLGTAALEDPGLAGAVRAALARTGGRRASTTA